MMVAFLSMAVTMRLTASMGMTMSRSTMLENEYSDQVNNETYNIMLVKILKVLFGIDTNSLLIMKYCSLDYLPAIDTGRRRSCFTSGGSTSRSTASEKMKKEMNKRNSPFMNPAKISALT